MNIVYEGEKRERSTKYDDDDDGDLIFIFIL